jgi:hypothetical protein
MIWKLQMAVRQKAALIALLAVGFIALAAGCVRYYYVLFLAHEDDLWYYMADSLNWCSIECYAGRCQHSFTTTLKPLMFSVHSTHLRFRFDFQSYSENIYASCVG